MVLVHWNVTGRFEINRVVLRRESPFVVFQRIAWSRSTRRPCSQKLTKVLFSILQDVAFLSLHRYFLFIQDGMMTVNSRLVDDNERKLFSTTRNER